MRDVQGHTQPNTVGSRGPVFIGGHVVQRVVTLEQFPVLPLGLKEEDKIFCLSSYSLVGFIWSWSSEQGFEGVTNPGAWGMNGVHRSRKSDLSQN